MAFVGEADESKESLIEMKDLALAINVMKKY